MNLNSKQKEYIRKKYKKYSVEQIARNIKTDSTLVNNYIDSLLQRKTKDKSKDKIGKKFNLWVNIDENLLAKIKSFSFKRFLTKYKWYLLGLIAVCFLAFGNSFNNEFLSDDIAGISLNEEIGKTKNIFSSITVVQNFLFYLITNIFGKSFFWFRIINNFIPHIAVVLGVFVLAYLLFDEKVALFASLLTAVHPILVEAAVWIAAGVYARYSAFLIWGLIFYILSIKKDNYIYTSLGLFALGLFSTEKALVYIGLLFLLFFCFGIYNSNWKRTVIIFGGTTIVFGIIYLSLLWPRAEQMQTDYYEDPLIKTNLFNDISLAIGNYLRLFVWPDKLTLYHSDLAYGKFDLMIKLILLGIYVLGLLWSFIKNRKIFFTLFWLVVCISPTLLPIKIAWLVAERYVYLGAIGLIMLMAMGLAKFTEKRKNEGFGYLIFALVFCGGLMRTIVRNNDWQNQDNLWLSAATTSPSSAQNYNNLGDLYGRRGEFPKAIEAFSQAIVLKPDFADAYHNLGNIYQQIGDSNLAAEYYYKAYQIDQRLWQSAQNLAYLFYLNKNYEEALSWVDRAIEIVLSGNAYNSIKNGREVSEIHPATYGLLSLRGFVLLDSGNKEEATKMFEQAINIDPKGEMAREGLAKVKS